MYVYVCVFFYINKCTSLAAFTMAAWQHSSNKYVQKGGSTSKFLDVTLKATTTCNQTQLLKSCKHVVLAIATATKTTTATTTATANDIGDHTDRQIDR